MLRRCIGQFVALDWKAAWQHRRQFAWLDFKIPMPEQHQCFTLLYACRYNVAGALSSGQCHAANKPNNHALTGRRAQKHTVRDNDTRLIRVASDIPMENIRNFSFIAHVDHGKSTLADRLLEMLGNVSKQGIEEQQQFLDNLQVLMNPLLFFGIWLLICVSDQVERERGITVKAQTASMVYTDEHGNEYLLNMVTKCTQSKFHSLVTQIDPWRDINLTFLVQRRTYMHDYTKA